MANFYRKVFVIASLNWVSISQGITYGQIGGMIRALQKQDDGIILTEGEISVIGACVVFSCIIGLILLGMTGHIFARRWAFILFSIPLVINWIILIYAREFPSFLISRLLAGISVGPLTVLSLIAAAEYTSPKSRALFMSMVSMVAPALGTGVGHVLGVLIHWRTLAVGGIFVSIIHVVLPYFWVESPHWLASKGQFENCERAFRKLHGNTPSSDQELRLIIKMESSKQEKANKMNAVKKLIMAFRKRYFWNLMTMNTFTYIYYAAAGKSLFTNLASVILEEMTGTSDILLYTLLVDGCILIATCISCILITKMSIRILLFSSGSIAVGILVVLSACLYFQNGEAYSQWINVILLGLYFVIIHVGPYPVLEILLGEMFPMELKLYSFAIAAPVIAATVFASLLLLPTLISLMGYHGLYLLNSVIMIVCLVYLWMRLPETKGKTLQEIEVYFKANNFDVDEVLSNEQIKALI